MTEVQAAEARVAEARQRLQSTTAALQAKLDPKIMAREAVESITDTTERALRSGADAVRANPGDAAGAVGIVAVALAGLRILASRRRKKSRRDLLTVPPPTVGTDYILAAGPPRERILR